MVRFCNLLVNILVRFCNLHVNIMVRFCNLLVNILVMFCNLLVNILVRFCNLLALMWISWSGSVIYLLSKTFKLFGFPVIQFWVYQIKVIPEHIVGTKLHIYVFIKVNHIWFSPWLCFIAFFPLKKDQEPSWLWSYCCWIYIYICNQCL